MKRYYIAAILLLAVATIPSCEFSCTLGNKKDKVTGSASEKNGARLYNGIKADFYKVQLTKAFLLFGDNTRVPEDNFTDFSQPVKLELEIKDGWAVKNGKVLLGASEKIIDENGNVILNEPDLFKPFGDGVNPNDAKSIFLKATIRPVDPSIPTSFSIQFRVWDKQGEGYIEGSYMLFSKK